MASKDSQMEKFSWAKDTIITKIEAFLASPNSPDPTIESLMTKKIDKDTKTITRKDFIETIKNLNIGILPLMIENLADSLLTQGTQNIDITYFYKVYHYFIPFVDASVIGPLTTSINIEGKQKILDSMAKYMKSQKFNALSDFCVIKFENGQRIIDPSEINTFLTKNFPMLTSTEKDMFCANFKVAPDKNELNVEKIQNEILQILTPKNIDEFMEEIRFNAIFTGSDISSILQNSNISIKDLENLFVKIGSNLQTARIEKFYDLLDPNKTGTISKSEFLQKLSEISISHSGVINSSHSKFEIFGKLRESIKKSNNLPLHCVLRNKTTKDSNGKLWVESKELKNALINYGLTESEFNSLMDFLDPGEISKIDYERFFELLGYIQPLGNKPQENVEKTTKIISLKNCQEIIPLLKCLKDNCDSNNIKIEELFAKYNLNKPIGNRIEIHKTMQELCRGKISDGDIFEGLQEIKTKSGEISLEDLLKLYKEFIIPPAPSSLPKEQILKIIAEKAYDKGIDLREILVKNDTSSNRTIRTDLFIRLIGDSLFLGADLIQSLNNLMSEYDNMKTGKLFYNVFLDDLKPYYPKGIPIQKNTTDLPRFLLEIMQFTDKNNIDLQAKFKENDYESKNTVSVEVFVKILKDSGLPGYDENNFMDLAKKYTSPMSSEVQYKLFIAELKHQIIATQNASKVKTNLQWATKILDEIAIYMHYKHETVLSYFKNYELDMTNKTVSLMNFMIGIRALNIRVSERDIEQLGKDLDVFYNNTVSIEELNYNIEDRMNSAIAKYERNITRMLFDCVKAKNVDLVKAFKKYDSYNMKEISSFDFERELRLIMGANLNENQYQYIISKYEKRPGKTGYYDFIQAIDSEKGLQSVSDFIYMNPLRIQLVDRLRQEIRKRDLKIASTLLSLNKAGNLLYDNNIILSLFPKEILSTEDFIQLTAIMDEKNTGTFHYDSMCSLLWTNEEEESSRENAMKTVSDLNIKVASYLRKKNADLEQEFVKLDRECIGFLSSDDIKFALTNCGMPLSYKQLAALVYYQDLITDIRYRKNYIQLSAKILGESNIEKRFPQIKLQKVEGEIMNKNTRKVTFGEDVEEIKKKPQEMNETPNFKKGGPPNKENAEKVMEYIIRNITNDKIDNIYSAFRKNDTNNSECIEQGVFINTMSNEGIVLTPDELRSILLLPNIKSSENSLNYVAFFSELNERRKSNPVNNSVAEISKPEPQPQPSEIPKIDQNNKEELKIPTTQPYKILTPKEVPLDDVLIDYIVTQLGILKEHLVSHGVKVEEEFGLLQKDGFIDFSQFCELLYKNNVDQLSQEVIDIFYSYLKEDRTNKIAYSRLITVLVNGKKIPPWKSTIAQQHEIEIKQQIIGAGLHVRRLTEYMKKNEIDFKIFTKYANGRILSKENLKLCFEDIKYDCPESELEVLFKNIEIRENEGSLAQIISMLYEANEQKPKQKMQLEGKAADAVANINKELAEKKISYNQVYEALDFNKDGFIDNNELLGGITSKLKLGVAPDSLLELFKVLDTNQIGLMSINHLGLYIHGARKAKGDRVNEIGIDDQIKLEIEHLFEKLDYEKNGFLTESKLFEAVSASSHYKFNDAQLKEAFRVLDSNTDGKISKEEFMEFMVTQIKHDIISAEDEMEDLKEMFKQIDIDGSGYLDVEEV